MVARVIRVATTQFAVKEDDMSANIAAAEVLIRAAAADGANIVLIQELFAGNARDSVRCICK